MNSDAHILCMLLADQSSFKNIPIRAYVGLMNSHLIPKREPCIMDVDGKKRHGNFTSIQ